MQALIFISMPLPDVLCTIIVEYAKNPKDDLLSLLQSSPNFEIVLQSSFYSYEIKIKSQSLYRSKVPKYPISICSGKKCNQRHRNFNRFWIAIENKHFTQYKVFGRDYQTFETDLLALI